MDKNINKYILRRENADTNGWEVRIVRSKGVVRELFSDSNFKGKQNALKEAQKFRNMVVKKIPPLNRIEIANLAKKSNKSESVGVSLVKSVSINKNGKKTVTEYYQAYWSPEKGKPRAKRFSVKKYGKELAFKLAMSARKKGVKEMSL